MKESNCTFVTVWDGSTTIRTAGYYDAKTGEVESLETVNADGLECLDREYIELDNGDELNVCKCCHERVLKTRMVDDPVGNGLHEEEFCPECD